jgi:acetyltransferase-like isoleucine patch superfamily enzyme/dTDP-4-dehydrorhamnose 3,5-epimerase-like enzyme
MTSASSHRDVFVHEKALCESEEIGAGTRVWAFAHLLPGAVIGRNCNICDHVFIENDVVVGDDVTIKSGVQLWDGIRLGNRVFIGPNVTFCNDRYPRSKQHLASFPQTIVEEGASVGANATILPGVRIGRNAMIGAGAVVTKSVPANAVVVGNPAAIVGYQAERVLTKSGEAVSGRGLGDRPGSRQQLSVKGCELWRLPQFEDMRGSIVPIEFSKQGLPFAPLRAFVVYDVPSREVRGEHAHRTCKQFLIAAQGQLAVVIDDGRNREEVVLDKPTIGLFIPPLIWCTQYKFESHATLAVFASEPYRAEDYIRDYDGFIAIVQAEKSDSRD